MNLVKNKINSYKIFTVLFLVFSLFGAMYLVGLNQDIRDKAVGNGSCACKDKVTGATSTGTCKADGGCICPSGTNPGTNKCDVGAGSGGDTPNPNDKCQSGQTSCQQNSTGKNTGYNCTCITALDPNDWQCTTQDLKTCPTEGGVDANAGYCDPINKIKISGRCLVADAGSKIKIAYKYSCPNQLTDLAGGCQQNEKVVQNVASVCFDNTFCGAQQIDLPGGSCFISVVDKTSCQVKSTPAPTITSTTRQPTITPTATKVPTRTPTPTATKVPTLTPTGTQVPTNTPTLTPTGTQVPTNTPTLTPTGTQAPTNTPINSPTPTNTPRYLTQAPSPTRIILPNSGIEFPIQALTVTGIIISLFGFLILL